MNRSLSPLYLAFYDASDGPRIMIFGGVDGSFASLRDVFQTLSDEVGRIELHRLPFIKTFGNVTLVASSAGSLFYRKESQSHGLRRRPTGAGVDFDWRQTAEGWDDVAVLADSLVYDPKPGHQYLSAYPQEDAIVVLSKAEYGDEVLRMLREEEG